MTTGYFNLDVKTVNKAKQSAVAMSAYRSGEKLYSERDGLTKKYKARPVAAENFILKPDHAPEWTLERERLWNEVERFEARDNARIARSVLLSLPNDMTHDQQLELTQEYIQENFADAGMVADTSIHREDINNPHAHVLLTVRPFDAEGNWEKSKSKRVPILDENGQQTYNEKGWRNTRSVKINDWDDKTTLKRWRENWSDKLNEKSRVYGLAKTYNHASFEAQGKLEKPEIRLTLNEYQFEARQKAEALKNNHVYKPSTYFAKKNAAVKQANEQVKDVIHLIDYKQQTDYKAQLNKLRRNLHSSEANKKATQLLVDRVKGYVDYKVSKDLYNDFNNDRNKWKLKLERATSLINSRKDLYMKLIKQSKKNPSIVKRYGYSIDKFKEEMKEDLSYIEADELKVSAEYEKFNELKQATITSYDYQKELIDMEFSSIYSDINKNDFSYDEKYFAMKLLKDHNIMLPEGRIKTEFVSQDKNKELNNKYIPLWKQAKDTLTSISIYERTIKKLDRVDINKIAPDKLKERMINLNSIKILKNNYEKYIQEVTPMINNEIENISDNIGLNNSDINVKVAVLEKYSLLSDAEHENFNFNEFVVNLQAEYNHEAEQYTDFSHNQAENDEAKEIGSEIAAKSKEIATGLLDVLRSLLHEQSDSQERSKKDRTKPFRKRGTDGREL